MNQEYKPSEFAALGSPSCSIWGKSEIEWIALAYVQALSNLGDTWQPLTRSQAYEALTEEQKRETHGMLQDDYYQCWFDGVARRIDSPHGALSVRGFWNERRLLEVAK